MEGLSIEKHLNYIKYNFCEFFFSIALHLSFCSYSAVFTFINNSCKNIKGITDGCSEDKIMV